MKPNRLTALLSALLACLVLVAGCSSTPPPGAASPADGGAGSGAPAQSAPQPATEPAGDFAGVVKFGVSASITGTNSMVGEYVMNGAALAADKINAGGGILGHRLELVFEDEVDSLQTAVNAQVKLMNDPDIVAFFGSTNSSKCIAVMPNVLEKQIPMFAGGSSANIPLEQNPYVWQVRMVDDQSGLLLAKTAAEKLGMRNPAILYSTESFGQGLRDQTVEALGAMGVSVSESNIYGYVTEEKNFAPIISQIQNSDVDGLIAIGSQLPAAIICQQVEASGLDIPMVGSSSWASAVCRENAGDSANGWYSVADWTVDVITPAAREFADSYQSTFGNESDMPAVTAYDSVLLFAQACELAGTVTDREAINSALAGIRDFEGAMSTYSYADNHCFSTSQFLTLNTDGKATMVDVVSVR